MLDQQMKTMCKTDKQQGPTWELLYSISCDNEKEYIYISV